jgi:hypothetical protein
MVTPQDHRLIVSSRPTGQLIAFRRLLHAVAFNLSYNNGTSSPRSFCDSSGLLRVCAERSAVTELPTILSDRIGVSHSRTRQRVQRCPRGIELHPARYRHPRATHAHAHAAPRTPPPPAHP